MIFERRRPIRSLSRGISGATLGLALTAGASGTAFAAHHQEAPFRPLRGLITSFSAGGLQLQTASGTVYVPLAKSVTHVLRDVMGSSADVTSGKHVDVHVIKGTRTVDVIRIEQSKPAASRPGGATMPPRTGDRAMPHHDGNSAPPQVFSGQVVSLNGNTLTLRLGNGSTGTFTLGSQVNVDEVLTGSLADLGVGETIQVFLGKSGSAARSIIILNA